MMVSCKDSSKTPSRRVVEMNPELFMLDITIERRTMGDGGSGPGDDPGVTTNQIHQSMNMETEAMGGGGPQQALARQTLALNEGYVANTHGV